MLFDFIFKKRDADTSINKRIESQNFKNKEIEALVKRELNLLTLGQLVDYYFENRCKELSKKTKQKS